MTYKMGKIMNSEFMNKLQQMCGGESFRWENNIYLYTINITHRHIWIGVIILYFSTYLKSCSSPSVGVADVLEPSGDTQDRLEIM
jgi:hypothetical protein